MAAAADAEDVNDFLRRIKELGHPPDQEEEERSRRLEEEILQGRKERQARRAERSRSLSPTKNSHPSTPTQTEDAKAAGSSREPSSAQRLSLQTSRYESAGRLASPDKEASSSRFATPEPAPSLQQMSPRNSPMSWQRRPPSQSSDRPRPLSMAPVENAAARSPRADARKADAGSPDRSMTRGEIAQALQKKDPSWFRQTPDRGDGSPAYRRSHIEEHEAYDLGSPVSRVLLPGMTDFDFPVARKTSAGQSPTDHTTSAGQSPLDAVRRVSGDSTKSRLSSDTTKAPSAATTPHRSVSPMKATPILSPPVMQASSAAHRASPVMAAGRFGADRPASPTKVISPMPLSPAPRLDPPSPRAISESRSFAMSPSQGRISPERMDRPVSPTKGVGGFVQSAMMKRSDSVKKWNVQAPPGLRRGDSVASNRSSKDLSLMLGGHGASRPSSPVKDRGPPSPSRPGSSHGTGVAFEKVSHSSVSGPGAHVPNNSTSPKSITHKPDPLDLAKNDPSPIKPDADADADKQKTTPPVSPSKTMDPRRWSPTKASWLESALNKPESPKIKPPVPLQQPAWKVELNKTKAKENSAEHKPAPKHQVTIGGLMRGPALGGSIPKPSEPNLLFNKANEAPVKRLVPASRSLRSSTPDRTEDSSASAKSSPTAKPETPPSVDFRSVLKPRQVATGTTGKEEPEFKNVFGSLRRTKTQNYVAPDVLKDNITRGKAALSATGGPRKSDRVDEFKDAIQRKKADFKKAQEEGRGVPRSVSGGSTGSAVPEAITKRRAMVNKDSKPVETQLEKADAPEDHTLRKELSAPARMQGKNAIGAKLADRFNPALAGLLARGPPAAPGESSKGAALSVGQNNATKALDDGHDAEVGSRPQLTHMTKGRARGPRRKAPTTTAALQTTIDAVASPAQATAAESQQTGSVKTPLASTTETRSPPIRAAASSGLPGKLSPGGTATDPKDELSSSKSPAESPKKASLGHPTSQTPSTSSTTRLPEANFNSKSTTSSSSFGNIEQKPQPSATQPSPRPDSSIVREPERNSVRDSATKWGSPKLGSNADQRARSPVKLPTREDEKMAMINAGLRPPSPVKVAAASSPSLRPSSPVKGVVTSEIEVRSSSPVGSVAPSNAALRSLSPVKVKVPQTQLSEPPARLDAGGLGIQTGSRPLPTPPAKSPISSDLKSPQSAKSLRSINSPLPAREQPSEASKLVAEFFGGPLKSPDYAADTASILAASTQRNQDIRTVSTKLYQLTLDGKKVAVPAHQERLLFEGDLHLCVHSFNDATIKKFTNVYYWSGDDVPDAKVSELAIFAQREAKNAGGQLIKIRQGQEPSEFLQALGGVVMIQRGVAAKYDSLAPRVLCARQVYGQVVFDEVDYAASSLCSGFSYLITTPTGKMFIWKGRGSGIDELSCARLIGMETSMTGDIEEIDDGKEPQAFLQVFGKDSNGVPKSADHWHLKPTFPQYSTRLFQAHTSGPSQITEHHPFSQTSLTPQGIYILDAFFEMYVLVGSRTIAQYAAFHHALRFAQEYGILAAGMEDRPHIPTCTVVFGGAPRDMKFVFRKWRDEASPTMTPLLGGGSERRESLTSPTSVGVGSISHEAGVSGGGSGVGGGGALARGKSLRVVTLGQALEAARV